MYNNDFLLASNSMTTLIIIKKSLTKKYNIKDLGKGKIIISWQVTRNTVSHTIKIEQSAFIRDLITRKRLTECNANFILIKTKPSIKMSKLDDYNKINLYIC